MLGLDQVSLPRISPAELNADLDRKELTVIDFAAKPQYGEGHVRGVFHAIRANLAQNLTQMPTAGAIDVQKP